MAPPGPQQSDSELADEIRQRRDISGPVPISLVEQLRQRNQEARQDLRTSVASRFDDAKPGDVPVESTEDGFSVRDSFVQQMQRQRLREQVASDNPGVSEDEVAVQRTDSGFEAQVDPDVSAVQGVEGVDDNLLNAALPENQVSEIQDFEQALDEAGPEVRREFGGVIEDFRTKKQEFKEGVSETFTTADPDRVASSTEELLEITNELDSEDVEQDLEEFEEEAESERQVEVAEDLVFSAQDAFDEDSIDTAVGNIDRDADEVTAAAEEIARGEEERERVEDRLQERITETRNELEDQVSERLNVPESQVTTITRDGEVTAFGEVSDAEQVARARDEAAERLGVSRSRVDLEGGLDSGFTATVDNTETQTDTDNTGEEDADFTPLPPVQEQPNVFQPGFDDTEFSTEPEQPGGTDIPGTSFRDTEGVSLTGIPGTGRASTQNLAADTPVERSQRTEERLERVFGEDNRFAEGVSELQLLVEGGVTDTLRAPVEFAQFVQNPRQEARETVEGLERVQSGQVSSDPEAARLFAGTTQQEELEAQRNVLGASLAAGAVGAGATSSRIAGLSRLDSVPETPASSTDTVDAPTTTVATPDEVEFEDTAFNEEILGETLGEVETRRGTEVVQSRRDRPQQADSRRPGTTATEQQARGRSEDFLDETEFQARQDSEQDRTVELRPEEAEVLQERGNFEVVRVNEDRTVTLRDRDRAGPDNTLDSALRDFQDFVDRSRESQALGSGPGALVPEPRTDRTVDFEEIADPVDSPSLRRGTRDTDLPDISRRNRDTDTPRSRGPDTNQVGNSVFRELGGVSALNLGIGQGITPQAPGQTEVNPPINRQDNPSVEDSANVLNQQTEVSQTQGLGGFRGVQDPDFGIPEPGTRPETGQVREPDNRNRRTRDLDIPGFGLDGSEDEEDGLRRLEDQASGEGEFATSLVGEAFDIGLTEEQADTLTGLEARQL